MTVLFATDVCTGKAIKIASKKSTWLKLPVHWTPHDMANVHQLWPLMPGPHDGKLTAAVCPSVIAIAWAAVTKIISAKMTSRSLLHHSVRYLATDACPGSTIALILMAASLLDTRRSSNSTHR